jgi:Fibronectin type III domain
MKKYVSAVALVLALFVCQIQGTAYAATSAPVLSAVSHTASSITLSWTTPESLTGVTDNLVEVKAPGGNWQGLPITVGVASSVVVPNLTAGTLYRFRVTPITQDGFLATSNVISEYPSTNPAVASMQSITPLSDGRFAIAWTPNSDGGSPILGYKILYSPDASNWMQVDTVGTLNNYISSSNLPIIPGDAAFFRAVPFNRDGPADTSGFSSFDNFRNVSGGQDTSLGTQCKILWPNTITCPGYQITNADHPLILLAGSKKSSGYFSVYLCYISASGFRHCFENRYYCYSYGCDYSTADNQASNNQSWVGAISAVAPAQPVVTVINHDNTSVTVKATIASTGGTPVGSFQWQYSADNGQTWIDSSISDQTATIGGLLSGTTYSFRALAINSEPQFLKSPWSNKIAEYPSSAPSAPKLTLSNDTPTSLAGTVDVNNPKWMSGGAESQINSLQYSIDGSRWYEINNYSRGLNGTYSFRLENLTNGRNYMFRSNLSNRDGQGPWSTVVSGIPSVTPIGVGAVSILKHTGSTVGLAWIAPADDGGQVVSDYVVQYSVDGGLTWVTFNDGVSAATSVTVTGLSSGVTYKFRVAAVNPVGQGAYSDLVSEHPSSVPSVSSLQVASKTDTSVSLGWVGTPNGDDITDYVIQYSADSGATWTTFNDGVSATQSTTVQGLTRGTSYVFRVAAINRDGQGGYSISTSAIASTFPSKVVVTIGSHTAVSVALRWVAPDNGGQVVSDYVVQYSVDGGLTWVTFNDGVSAATSVTVTGLSSGVTYKFRVAAVNPVGQGAYSDLVSEHPSSVPSVSSLQVASKTDTSVSLGWVGTPNGDDITDYVIQYSADSGATWTTFNDGVSATQSTTVQGLTRGTSYVFRVAAINRDGQGAMTKKSMTVIPLAQQSQDASVTIIGKYKLNQNLVVVVHNFAPGTAFTYKWMIDGKVLPGATLGKLKITTIMKSHKVSLVWSATATGYLPLSQSSVAVKIEP